MSGIIYADLRCLQDHRYRVRGIGHHLAALLRTRGHSALSRWKMIGLVDPASPKLPFEIASLVDEVSTSANPRKPSAPAIFIDGTPMTHDSRFSLRFRNHPAFFRAAVVHDFIPLDWPGYLPTIASRIDYVAKLAHLRGFDVFFPVSEYTAWRLSEILGVSNARFHVTGSSVRGLLYQLRDALGSLASPYDANEPYFLIVTGPDSRKNPEVVVRAVLRLNLLYGRRIPLKVVGHFEDYQKLDLLGLAGHAEDAGFLEFRRDVSDAELVSLLAGAIAAVVPSHIEGFSLPVVEAAVCGCPVIASTCAAHLELVDRSEALFQSDDSAALAERLEDLLIDPPLRGSLLASQANLAATFHEEEVGKRFWCALDEGFEKRSNNRSYAGKKKPRIAFLSPYPPDQSGVARYTAMTLQAGEKLFNSDLYTDAARPLTFEGCFRDAGPVSVAALADGRYDAVVSVLGNSRFHTPIFDVFERYGGPCILHDSRLTHIYINRLGQENFVKLAASLLGRPVTMEEVGGWLEDRNPPLLLLDLIVQRAEPLIVHTVTQQAQIRKRYGVHAEVIPCCPTMFFGGDELTAQARLAARERCGIADTSFLVSSFGMVFPEKSPDTCVLAIELLRSWNIPAELYFVGGAGSHKAGVDHLAALYGIAEYVHCSADFIDEATYRDFLIASDAGLQLRTYGFGQFSASLTDCISAGLRCVANSDLAKSCDAPEYVFTVPDSFSPLLVAEQLALIWERRAGPRSYQDLRRSYLETHNFEYYGNRLIEVLGIA
jgi:glycosyltransferase involved in cell wall biosynthesis